MITSGGAIAFMAVALPVSVKRVALTWYMWYYADIITKRLRVSFLAKRGKQPSGILTRQKMMNSAVTLFLEKGYHNTTTASISRKAGMTGSSFFRAFENKEAVLLALVEDMFDSQFEMADFDDPLMVYAVETSIQMNIAELNESLRDLYVTAYSLPATSEYIYRRTADKLKQLFNEYMPEADDREFYEMEIASAGITRGYMAKACSDDFTMEMKLSRYIRCCMRLYRVPEDKIDQAIEKTLAMDLKPVAEKLVNAAISRYRDAFEKVISVRPANK